MDRLSDLRPNDYVMLVPGAFHVPEGPDDEAYLIGSRCRACGATVPHLMAVCPACVSADTMEEVPMGQRGRLYSFTIANVAPVGFTAPYFQAYVELPEGPRVFALISDDVPVEAGALADGMEMELVIEPVRKDEQGRPVLTYKYRPVASNGAGA